jgi:hypothetical protein
VQTPATPTSSEERNDDTPATARVFTRRGRGLLGAAVLTLTGTYGSLVGVLVTVVDIHLSEGRSWSSGSVASWPCCWLPAMRSIRCAGCSMLQRTMRRVPLNGFLT